MPAENSCKECFAELIDNDPEEIFNCFQCGRPTHSACREPPFNNHENNFDHLEGDQITYLMSCCSCYRCNEWSIMHQMRKESLDLALREEREMEERRTTETITGAIAKDAALSTVTAKDAALSTVTAKDAALSTAPVDNAALSNAASAAVAVDNAASSAVMVDNAASLGVTANNATSSGANNTGSETTASVKPEISLKALKPPASESSSNVSTGTGTDLKSTPSASLPFDFNMKACEVKKALRGECLLFESRTWVIAEVTTWSKDKGMHMILIPIEIMDEFRQKHATAFASEVIAQNVPVMKDLYFEASQLFANEQRAVFASYTECGHLEKQICKTTPSQYKSNVAMSVLAAIGSIAIERKRQDEQNETPSNAADKDSGKKSRRVAAANSSTKVTCKTSGVSQNNDKEPPKTRSNELKTKKKKRPVKQQGRKRKLDPSSSSPPLSPPVHSEYGGDDDVEGINEDLTTKTIDKSKVSKPKRKYGGDDDVEGINEDLTTITIDKSKVSKSKRKASDSAIKSGSNGTTTEPTTSTMFTTSASISTMFKEDRDVSILFY
jgi:hypothetical protein